MNSILQILNKPFNTNLMLTNEDLKTDNGQLVSRVAGVVESCV